MFGINARKITELEKALDERISTWNEEVANGLLPKLLFIWMLEEACELWNEMSARRRVQEEYYDLLGTVLLLGKALEDRFGIRLTMDGLETQMCEKKNRKKYICNPKWLILIRRLNLLHGNKLDNIMEVIMNE